MRYSDFRRDLIVSVFVPTISILAVLTAVVLRLVQQQAFATRWVESSYEVIVGIKSAELELREMQLGLHRYLQYDDKRYLTKVSDHGRRLSNHVAKIATLLAGDPDQKQRLAKIGDLSEKWTESVKRLVNEQDTRQSNPDALAQARLSARALFDSLANMLSAEYRLRADRVARQKLEYRRLFLVVPILSAIAVFCLGYWAWHQIQSATGQFREALDLAENARAAAEKAGVEAKEANEAKDKFLGTVSHELRNPLNSIMLWSATLLEDPVVDDRVRRRVGSIEQAGRVLAHLVDDLLDVSRIDTGRLRLEIEMFDAAEVVRAGVEGMRAAAEAKSVTLHEMIDSRVGSIAGDPARLQQVVWNLVSNAVKFTPKGGSVQVRLRRLDWFVEIIVADTGVGIDPISLGSVFERFWQGNSSTQRKQGVGLGLSIVKEIVNLHGGNVSAHSDGAGKGSTFTVRFPLLLTIGNSQELGSEATAAQVSNAADAADLAGAADLHGVSILVVDDSPNSGQALKNVLGLMGASVTVATSAGAGLAKLGELPFDAVVADTARPGDGYYLAGELRRWEGDIGTQEHIPLVALTAPGRAEDRAKIFMVGFDGHALKPVNPVELSKILATLIGYRRKVAAKSQEQPAELDTAVARRAWLLRWQQE